MSIKNDVLYPKYLIWLEDKKMSSGIKELSKMSASLFEQFKFRYELNPSLKEKIDNRYKAIDREEKIEDIVKDDFELFLEEISHKTLNSEDLYDF
jgi:hypothetical protein